MKVFPKLTVITVTFNLIKNGRKDFFRQCVESVHNQTYPNIEHLIVDGASTDGTLDLIKEYADKGWIRYISEPDQGVWEAMNKAAKCAEGKYIIYLNSDDYFYQSGVLEECVKQLEENGSDECYCVANVCGIKEGKLLLKGEGDAPFPKEHFCLGQTYNHETLVCAKSIYEKLNYHTEKYRTAIDYEFNIKLVLNGYKQLHVSKCLTAFRLGGETTKAEGGPTDVSIDNVLKLYQDYFPWAEYTREKVVDLFSFNKKPQNFRERAEMHIKELKLKNFDYDLFTKILYNKTRHIYLFKYIKILSVYECKNEKKYNLLSVIPLLSIRRSRKGNKVNLFGVIPFLRIKEI